MATPLRVAVTLMLLVACAAIDAESLITPSDMAGPVDGGPGAPVVSAQGSEPSMTAGAVTPLDVSTELAGPTSAEAPGAEGPAMMSSPPSVAVDSHLPNLDGPKPKDTRSTMNADEPPVVPLSQPSESIAAEELSKKEDLSNLAGVNPATNLETTDYSKLAEKMDKRKLARLEHDAEVAARRSRIAKAEAEYGNKRLSAARASLTALFLQHDSLTAANAAAINTARQVEAGIHALHNKEATASGVLAVGERALEEAKGYESATIIQQEMQNAEAGAGGGDEDDSDEHSAERRKFQNEEYQQSVNASAGAHVNVAADERTVEVQKTQVTAIETERTRLNDDLYQADHKMAGTSYDIEALERAITEAQEKVAQIEAEAKNADKSAVVAAKEAEAAEAAKARNASGEEAEALAEAMDPELRRHNAVKTVKDQDGIGDNGEDLISAPGVVSKLFENAWNKIPLPMSDNPLLNAAARAAVSDPVV